MTRSEKRKVLALFEAANEMAYRELGATAKWRKLLRETGPGLFGYKKGRVPAWAAGPITLGAAEGRAVFSKERESKEYLERKARVALEVAMQGRRGAKWTEDRALKLMEKSLSELLRMRRDIRAKKKAKKAA